MGLDIFINKVKTKRLGYFRKVNFLVKYFQDLGFDVQNQTPFTFDKEIARDLLNRCKQVLKDHSKAEELLPTMDGFFFGSTEYDGYYFDNVKLVKEYIQRRLLPEFDNLDKDEEIEFATWY